MAWCQCLGDGRHLQWIHRLFLLPVRRLQGEGEVVGCWRLNLVAVLQAAQRSHPLHLSTVAVTTPVLPLPLVPGETVRRCPAFRLAVLVRVCRPPALETSHRRGHDKRCSQRPLVPWQQAVAWQQRVLDDRKVPAGVSQAVLSRFCSCAVVSSGNPVLCCVRQCWRTTTCWWPWWR